MTATAPNSWSDSDWKAICEQLDRIVKSGPIRAIAPQRSCCERELQDDRFWHIADIDADDEHVRFWG